ARPSFMRDRVSGPAAARRLPCEGRDRRAGVAAPVAPVRSHRTVPRGAAGRGAQRAGHREPPGPNGPPAAGPGGGPAGGGRAGRAVERMGEVLWDGQPPDGAERNVATLVSRLRSVIGTDAIAGGRSGYRLVTGDRLAVDVDEAERFVTEAEARLVSGQPSL